MTVVSFLLITMAKSFSLAKPSLKVEDFTALSLLMSGKNVAALFGELALELPNIMFTSCNISRLVKWVVPVLSRGKHPCNQL